MACKLSGNSYLYPYLEEDKPSFFACSSASCLRCNSSSSFIDDKRFNSGSPCFSDNLRNCGSISFAMLGNCIEYLAYLSTN